jgi:hypothetical protein
VTVYILNDTSTWLDLVKDYRLQPVIGALEHLVASNAVKLIVPEIVLEEFDRRKEDVARDAKRSLKAHFALVRDAIHRFAPEQTRSTGIDVINEADHAAVIKGEAVTGSIKRVAKLLAAASKYKATDTIKIRATERALARKAPFHRTKNAVADTIIIETYAQVMSEDQSAERYVFVTSNTHDFSQDAGDQRLPHDDLAPLFINPVSTYWISLADAINSIDEDLLPELDLDSELFPAPLVVGDPRGRTQVISSGMV